MTIDILMATYNGAKYLPNQLLSLQQQTHSDWKLWVRDDGSTDETVAIIDRFAKTDSRIKRITENSGKGLKAGANFLGLTKYSESEYAIFCDQDDIWFEKKLELLINFAKANFDNKYPCLVYCDGYGYSDYEGIITINSISKYHANSLKDFLFFNSGYQGCSILFNANLRRMAASYRADYFYMHDDVVSLLAHVFGQVYFIPKALMLYRQHSLNVTGNISTGFLDKWRRLIKINSHVIDSKHYREKKAFFDSYKEQLSAKDVLLFNAYLSFPKKNLIGRVGLILRYGFSIGGHKISLILKTIIRRPMG